MARRRMARKEGEEERRSLENRTESAFQFSRHSRSSTDRVVRSSFQTRVPSRLCSPNREETMEGRREKGRLAQKRKRSSEGSFQKSTKLRIYGIFDKEIAPNRTYSKWRCVDAKYRKVYIFLHL